MDGISRRKSVNDGQRLASEEMHSIGIRGIKYLDGSSRSKGDGDYNYVHIRRQGCVDHRKVQPRQQEKIPLQGGETGNPASWDAPGETFLDDVIYKLQNKNIDLKRVIEAVKATAQSWPTSTTHIFRKSYSTDVLRSVHKTS